MPKDSRGTASRWRLFATNLPLTALNPKGSGSSAHSCAIHDPGFAVSQLWILSITFVVWLINAALYAVCAASAPGCLPPQAQPLQTLPRHPPSADGRLALLASAR